MPTVTREIGSPAFDQVLLKAAWSEVQVRGFTVVSGFLSAAECEALLEEWRRAAGDSGPRANPNNNSRLIGKETRDRLTPKLIAATQRVAECTTTRVDRVRVGQFYATELGIDFDWHNDHDAYFHTQDFINYLNFWMPIQKPHHDRSGISVVPHDVLRSRSETIAAWVHGHGAITARLVAGRTVLFDADRNESVELDVPLNHLAVTPRLGPGDLLLMRGDLLHRTQDLETNRVAVSFRCIGSQSIITHAKLTQMGFHKFNVMSGNRLAFAKRFAAFEIADRDALTVAESEEICEILSDRLQEVCARTGRESPTNEQFRAVVLDLAAEYRRASRIGPPDAAVRAPE